MDENRRAAGVTELREPTAPARATGVDESPRGVCTSDPDRWTSGADEGAKALCRSCPMRWECAQRACLTPKAEGIWAGIYLAPAGRARRFALKQLQSLAEQNGYPVRRMG